jgi:hypothetical protein
MEQGQPDEEERDRSNWTIKNVEVEVRKLALAQATKQGLAMHEWLARAVRSQARLEAGYAVIPPERPPWPGQPSPPGRPTIIPAELSDLMRAAAELAQASGVPPKGAAKQCYALMTEWAREARGLPPPKKRNSNEAVIDLEQLADEMAGPTNKANGQTYPV